MDGWKKSSENNLKQRVWRNKADEDRWQEVMEQKVANVVWENLTGNT